MPLPQPEGTLSALHTAGISITLWTRAVYTKASRANTESVHVHVPCSARWGVQRRRAQRCTTATRDSETSRLACGTRTFPRRSVHTVTWLGRSRGVVSLVVRARSPARNLRSSCHAQGNLVRVHDEPTASGAALSQPALTAFCREQGLGQTRGLETIPRRPKTYHPSLEPPAFRIGAPLVKSLRMVFSQSSVALSFTSAGLLRTRSTPNTPGTRSSGSVTAMTLRFG